MLPHVSLRLATEIQARNTEPFDLARTHLKEIGDLLPGQD
jgi:hypothetical protein